MLAGVSLALSAQMILLFDAVLLFDLDVTLKATLLMVLTPRVLHASIGLCQPKMGLFQWMVEYLVSSAICHAL